LVFVSSTTIAASSSNVATYDAHVQALADAAGIGSTMGVTWTAVVSTSSVNARDHALVSGKVFNLDSDLIANDYEDMWDGSIQTNIDTMENGGSYIGNVWTGTRADGSKDGSNYMGGQFVTYGSANQSSASTWIRQASSFPNTDLRRIYALSSVITAVPEPGAVSALIMGGLVALSFLSGWRSRG
jgi:hypothetical protein